MRPLRAAALVGGLIALLVGFWLVNRNTAPSMDAPAVVAQVQRLNQLATVKYTVQKVVGLEERKQPIGMERILLILQAQVTAGVDLSGLRAEHITIGPDRTIVVRLPKAKLLNVSVDEKQTRVWDRGTTWWTPWVPYSKDLEQRARIEGLATARQAALEMGILDQAQRNAEDSIRTLLNLAGAPSVQVFAGDQS